MNYHLHVYMNISTYHVHTCIKVTSILTILYLLIHITSLIWIEPSHYFPPTKMRKSSVILTCGHKLFI